jgi:hypothetical protein
MSKKKEAPISSENPIQIIPQEQEKKANKIEVPQLFNSIYEGYGPNSNDQTKQSNANSIILKYLKQEILDSPCFDKYNIIVLYDSTTMVKSDADNIYNAVTTFTEKKPLLLILYSNGGVIGSAYLIGKLCREYSSGNFTITVPRHAKSAATLLCCAADEIHMGSLSELGPIDPQIDDLPALGLKNSIQHIAQLVKETPESAEMFSTYLNNSLKLIDLGHYERVAESAMHYAIRLLGTHAEHLLTQPNEIARRLVYSYKDHGFVIDKSEAAKIFGEKVVKTNTDEYSLGNNLYKALDLIQRFLNVCNYRFYFIGSLESGLNINKRS